VLEVVYPFIHSSLAAAVLEFTLLGISRIFTAALPLPFLLGAIAYLSVRKRS
jgi:hypothetical protein